MLGNVEIVRDMLKLAYPMISVERSAKSILDEIFDVRCDPFTFCTPLIMLGRIMPLHDVIECLTILSEGD